MAKPQSKQRETISPDVLAAFQLQAQGHTAEAETRYRQILAARPGEKHALNQLGMICYEREHYVEALELFAAAAKIDRASGEAAANHGAALNAVGRYAEALAVFDRALILKPGYVPALHNRGRALMELGRHADALRSFDRVIALDPSHVDALYERGNALRELRRHDEALGSYRRALALRPESADVHVNEALTLLRLGDFRVGLPKYEWRWRRKDVAGLRRNFAQPLWRGEEPIDGKTILLHAEQGFGDTIQFARYAALVAARGARVVLEVQPQLKPLIDGMNGPAAVVSRGEALPPFDLHCPLLSLPLACGTTLDTIPSAIPYLDAPPRRVAAWRERLPAAGRRVGLVWAGSAGYASDRNRTLRLDRLAPLFGLPGIAFVSLQRDLRDGEAEALRTVPGLVDLGRDLVDFADTAAVVSMLDLVVSVDTAVAHLAGAMGKLVLVLLPHSPDFRWLLDRPDSPWYPTARLYRQPAFGDWDSVIARVRADLAARTT